MKRTNLESWQPQSMVQLTQGVLSKNSMTSRDKDINLYIKTNVTKSFSIQVNQIKGQVWFDVIEALDGKAVPSATPWISRDNRLRIDVTENLNSSSEYIVTVHSEAEAYFSIIYNLED